MDKGKFMFTIICIAMLAAVAVGMKSCIDHETARKQERREQTLYEVTILNKYSDLDNHFMSGSSTRYVVYVEVRQVHAYGDESLYRHTDEFEVSGTAYGKATIGRRYVTHDAVLFDRHMEMLLMK